MEIVMVSQQNMNKWIAVLLIGVLGMVGGISTLAQEVDVVAVDADAPYTSAHGYTIRAPEGWIVADQAFVELVTNEGHNRYPELQSVDFNKIDVMFFEPEGGDFATNLNIVVVPSPIVANEKNLIKYEDVIRQQFTMMGLEVSELSGEIRTVGANRCLVMTYHAEMGDGPLAQVQYVASAGDLTCIITCTSKRGGMPKYQLDFEKAVGTLMILDAGGFWVGLNPILRNAILWGIVGGVIGGLREVIKKKKS